MKLPYRIFNIIHKSFWLISKAKLTGARFYLSANNLLTLTGYNGFDPEIGSGGWILDTGIDKGYYPSNKSVGLGLRVKF